VTTLVYLYGPPAAGKLTVATALAERTGYRLFHNHLTVNAIVPVFDFGTPAFERLLGLFRQEVFETAMRAGVDLIFTNNSAWPHADARERFAAYAAKVDRLVAGAGGRTCFVNITAPTEVLLARVAAESRRAHGKIVDPEQLRARLATFDPTPLHADHLVVDTSTLEPAAAAARIASHLSLSGPEVR
jgi:hypothetical protein